MPATDVRVTVKDNEGELMDVSNSQIVGAAGDGTVTVTWPRARMTRQEALVHAAWLVMVADPLGDEFADVMAQVQSA